LLRDALELVQTSVFEHKPRACREVLDSRRDEELARLSETSDSSTDIHGQPAELSVDHLDFTGVHSCPHVEAERRAGGVGAQGLPVMVDGLSRREVM
jgi:hypothetical protein